MSPHGVALLLLGLFPPVAPAAQRGVPWELRAQSWRTDPVWYDGLAEKCVYEATRTIYGIERQYLATAYTNKEQVDQDSTVKLEQGDDLLCFKHHWSERVPTENYDYDFSTSSYVVVDDLSAFKLTAATQEDCGASFKQVWRERGRLRYWESVYFPGAGTRQGSLTDPGIVFEDALALVLRDLPFPTAPPDGPAGNLGDDVRLGFELPVLPSQKNTHAVPYQPMTLSVVIGPHETLGLPCGEVRAWRVTLDRDGTEHARFWFAADGAAPWLHALVRYQGADGVRYELRSLERTAYWKRP
jgi:hypothetical protein